MSRWQSEPITVGAMTVDVRADYDGVVQGCAVGDSYATDLLLTPEQARALAAALLTGADEVEKAAAT